MMVMGGANDSPNNTSQRYRLSPILVIDTWMLYEDFEMNEFEDYKMSKYHRKC